MSFEIRPALTSDAPLIAEFQCAMASETEDLPLDPAIVQQGVAAVFQDPGRGKYLVAEAEGEVVASLLLTYEWSDWRNSNMWYIQSVYVTPQYRRRGAFRQMYQQVVQEARKQGVKCIRLYVETDNRRAQTTYQTLGMQRLPYFMYQQDLANDPSDGGPG